MSFTCFSGDVSVVGRLVGPRLKGSDGVSAKEGVRLCSPLCGLERPGREGRWGGRSE